MCLKKAVAIRNLIKPPKADINYCGFFSTIFKVLNQHIATPETVTSQN